MKKMKKLFSFFICCFFLAISCFVPLVLACDTPICDGVHCYFNLKQRPDVNLNNSRLTSWRQAVEQTSWIPEIKDPKIEKNSFFTIFSYPEYPDKRLLCIDQSARLNFLDPNFCGKVLAEEFASSVIVIQNNCFGSDQAWFIEFTDETHCYCRIKNVLTNHYVTYNPVHHTIYGEPKNEQNEENQVWKIIVIK